MRPISQLKIAALTLALCGVNVTRADDTDIFLVNSDTTASKPNLLLVLDVSANNNSSVTLLNGTSGDKLEMIRQVLNNIVDPMNSVYFPACTVTVTGGVETRSPAACVTRSEVNDLLSNVRMGLMIQNPSGSGKGGYVRYHIRDMANNGHRNGLLSTINPSIPQSNNAPYAKLMHEAYLYFGGKAAYVGFDSTLYDNAAKNGATTNYVSPIGPGDSCQNNYIIFVGNGGPDSSEDGDAYSLLRGAGGDTTQLSFTPNNFAGNYLDEYARFIKRSDVAPGVTGTQTINTSTIAVQDPSANNYTTNPMVSSRKLLNSAATQGGGEFYEAANGAAVMRAFVDMLRKMQPTNTAFASVTLPVSVNVRGAYLNQVYMGQFRPDANSNPRWYGNLKLYQIAKDVNGNPYLADRNKKAVEDLANGFLKSDITSFWTTDSTFWSFSPSGLPASSSDAPDGAVVEKGGAAQKLRSVYATSQTGRTLYTCTGTCASTDNVALSTTPFTTVSGILSALGTSDTTEQSNIVNWIRGQDNRDENNNNSLTDVRASIHGDVLHSRPAVVNYNRTPGDRDVVIYYGANDGVFHAVKGGMDDADGYEKWGIVFPEFFGSLKRMRDNSPNISSSTPKPYFADGPITVYQKDANTDGKINSANGDKAYLYVGMRRGGRFIYGLDVSDPDTPKKLWKISNTGSFAELGQSWSSARPAKIRAVSDPVVIFGAGYDAANEDALPATANTQGRGIFIANGVTGEFIKHIMPTGMGSVPADLTVLDRNGDGYADRIYTADTKGNIWRTDIDDADPDNWQTWKIATLAGTGADARKFLNKPDVVTTSEFDAILVGSGDREHPFDTTIANRFYMIKDPNTGLTGANLNITEDDLADVTDNAYQTASLPSTAKGWKFLLLNGEKVVGNAITVSGTTYFPTNIPTDAATGVCTANLGEARLYSVGYKTGNATQDLNGDGRIDASDRYEEVKGGGFLPSPTAADPVVDGQTLPVVCSGPHCVKPPQGNSSTKRYRTYWRTKLD